MLHEGPAAVAGQERRGGEQQSRAAEVAAYGPLDEPFGVVVHAGRSPGPGPVIRPGGQASSTIGMIIGRRRWVLETHRPTVRRMVCCSW